MKAYFQMMAGYNGWANAWLYAAAAKLPEEAYRRDVGLFFGSIHRTLNHLVLTDQIWLGRVDGQGETPGPLDRVPYELHRDLVEARLAADDRLVTFIASVPEDGFSAGYSYRNLSGALFTQPLEHILAHLLNHQAHHRGQAHSGLSIVGAEPPSLDMVGYHRGVPAPDREAMLSAARTSR